MFIRLESMVGMVFLLPNLKNSLKCPRKNHNKLCVSSITVKVYTEDPNQKSTSSTSPSGEKSQYPLKSSLASNISSEDFKFTADQEQINIGDNRRKNGIT